MKHKLLLLLACLLICEITQAQEMGTQVESDQPETTLTSNEPENQLLRMLEECIIKSKKEYESWKSSGINMPILSFIIR